VKTIVVDLNKKGGIESAIKELQQYKQSLNLRVQQLLQRFIDDGISIARAKVVSLGIKHDNNLSASINGMIVGNVGFIKVDDKNAVYFEFGTGPVGASSPHPLGGSYRSTAWYTKADGKPMDSLYGWEPLGNDGDTYYLTEGQKAKPFMYETALELRNRVLTIAKEVFST
jgi:hypothetical protein